MSWQLGLSSGRTNSPSGKLISYFPLPGLAERCRRISIQVVRGVQQFHGRAAELGLLRWGQRAAGSGPQRPRQVCRQVAVVFRHGLLIDPWRAVGLQAESRRDSLGPGRVARGATGTSGPQPLVSLIVENDMSCPPLTWGSKGVICKSVGILRSAARNSRFRTLLRWTSEFSRPCFARWGSEK